MILKEISDVTPDALATRGDRLAFWIHRRILERGLAGLTYRPYDWRLAAPATESWTARA